VSRTFQIDRYHQDDEPAVLELLGLALGPGPTGRRSPELFRWKHLANPFGRSLMLVAREGDRIIGLRAFMRWRFAAGGRIVRAARAVDTATHPEFQGRGVFSRLTREAVALLCEDTDLIYNTPNERSGPGYLKLGWRPVGTMGMSVRVRRPLRFLARLPSLRRPVPTSGSLPEAEAPPAAEVLAHPGLPALAREGPDNERLGTRRDGAFLRWRYGDAPLDYRAVAVEHGGRLTGIAVFRIRFRGGLREASLCDVVVADRRTCRRLVRRVVAAADVDHAVCRFPRGSVAGGAALRSGFLSLPGGPSLVVNQLTADLVPDPTELQSWALTLGDLEVF
jgi:GNAT superfamily N-acetyltransferase